MEHQRSARSRSRRRFGALAAAAAAIVGVLVAAPTAQAASQFTFFDQNNVLHDEDSYMQPNHRGPTDWTSPAYKDGHAYLRVEVTQKPSDKPVGGQICMWRDPKFAEETCSGFVVSLEPETCNTPTSVLLDQLVAQDDLGPRSTGPNVRRPTSSSSCG